MINLIGPDRKKHFHAARRNIIWQRYTTLLVAVLVAIFLVIGGSGFLLLSQIDASKKQVADNELLRDGKYLKIKKEAEEFRSNLANAKIILEAETSYSDVLVSFAKSIQSECVLSSIQLNDQGFANIQSYSFKCKNNNNIVPLKLALESSSLFSNVSLVSTSSPTVGIDKSDPYPVNVTIAAKINRPNKAATATQVGVQ